MSMDAIADTDRFKVLVFDASLIENSSQLRALYDFFHPTIRHIGKCGRIILIGTPPDKCASVSKACAQKALEGFVRSIAKEVGKKAATAQLIYVEPGAEKTLDATLAFLASPRSAYVDGQTIRINKTTGKAPEINGEKPLLGKVALVTGASRGIGEAIAEVLSRDGARVVCLDVPQAQAALETVAGRIHGETLCLDITSAEAPEKIASYFQNQHQGLDIIVHNAGVTRDKTLGRMKPEFWDLLMDINLSAILRINEKLLADDMINKNGRIIGVASISGIAGNFGQTNYATSKSGVIGYVEAMRDFLKNGITINAVAPGFIETAMTAAIPFTIREAGRRMNSLSQGGQPRDVAETIAYFASPGACGVSGNIVRVCGQSLLGK
jgi:3-oxoacyl-[acyl-carrier protein] reductase